MKSMNFLHQREIGRIQIHSVHQLPIGLIQSFDCYPCDISSSTQGSSQPLLGIFSKVEHLKGLVKRKYWEEISTQVIYFAKRLLEAKSFYNTYYSNANEAPSQSHLSLEIKHKKSQERDNFVMFDGINILFSILEAIAGKHRDGRKCSSDFLQSKVELICNTLDMMRELCSLKPNVAESHFSNQQMVFLFTLLVHDCIYEHVLTLLEEILVIRTDTFYLGEIPEFHSLICKLTSRQLAGFCRLLALSLYEPEDRQIIEQSQIVKSLELLQLRRERMAKSATIIVERNHSLLIQHADILGRLVLLLRLCNYGPTVHDLVTQNIEMPSPLSAEFFSFLAMNRTGSEWENFAALDRTATEQRSGRIAMSQLQSDSDPAGDIPNFDIFGHIDNLSMANFEENVTAMINTMTIRNHTPEQARSELRFQALLLSPHQVELLFVLCTLLSGRQKMDVQEKFALAGMPECLNMMFSRLSWDKTIAEGNNSIRHVHGPSCECTPESAIRVQFLRLVHNFCDRDFFNNPIKKHLLSPFERAILRHNNEELLIQNVAKIRSRKEGLLIKIIEIFLIEKEDSMYRFWLGSCIETFLRGSGQMEQLFVAHVGVLKHIVHYVCTFTAAMTGNQNLQSSFDLLAELCKCNIRCLEILDEILLSNDLTTTFWNVVSNNLVDSNVFIRSLFISLESINATLSTRKPFALKGALDLANITADNGFPPGYLSHSWIMFAPPILQKKSSPEKTIDSSNRPLGTLDAIKQSMKGAIENIKQAASSILKIGPSDDSALETSIGEAKGEPVSEPVKSGDDESREHSAYITTSHFTSLGKASCWRVPHSIVRIGKNVLSLKAHLVYKLMNLVSLNSINHENICCLNTLVMILVIAHQRGELTEFVNLIRRFSKAQKPNQTIDVMKAATIHVYEQPLSLDTILSQDEDQYVEIAVDLQEYDHLVSTNENTNDNEDCNSEQYEPCANFRRLLWYWQEYYLRRGRDRLSVEFSSRIPFAYWRKVVELLCRDDGSPTALLEAPINLPVSPYKLPSRYIQYKNYRV